MSFASPYRKQDGLGAAHSAPLCSATAEAATVADSFGGVVDVEQDAANLRGEGAAAPVESHAADAALEQGGAQVLLQHAHAVGDGGGGDAEFLASAGEALVAGGGLEEAQAVQGRKDFHGLAGVGHFRRTKNTIGKDKYIYLIRLLSMSIENCALWIGSACAGYQGRHIGSGSGVGPTPGPARQSRRLHAACPRCTWRRSWPCGGWLAESAPSPRRPIRR